MKKLLFFLLISNLAFGQIFPVETIVNHGANAKRINIGILADGYLSSEQAKFITDATNISNALLGQSPFLEYANFFNVYAIKVPSVQSGAKHPGTAPDELVPPNPVANPNNYFGSTFDAFSIHRLLVPNSTTANNVLAANLPDFDQGFVLVNSNIYGGSGGALATSSTDPSAAEVAIHELGHSFGFLADEYEIGGQGEKANRTTNTNPATIKWKSWLNTNGIGIYPIGVEGYQRPHETCKMRYLGFPFCSVCKEALISRIYSLVSPIDNFTPASNTVNFTGSSMNFSLGLVLPSPNTLNIQWLLNGNPLPNTSTNLNLLASSLAGGTNTLVANVTDNTPLSHVNSPPPPAAKVASINGYVNTVSWSITAAPLAVQFIDFSLKLNENNTELFWKTASESNSDYFEIQKSYDGTTFTNIGKVASGKNSKEQQAYQFTDFNPNFGVNYYRIQEIGSDGKKQQSKIIVANRQEKRHFLIYPNPVIDKLNVVLSSDNQEDMELTLVNSTGQILKTITFANRAQLQQELNVEGYTPGNYVLKIKMGSLSFQKSFVKL